jgi:hypothetical protein
VTMAGPDEEQRGRDHNKKRIPAHLILPRGARGADMHHDSVLLATVRASALRRHCAYIACTSRQFAAQASGIEPRELSARPTSWL